MTPVELQKAIELTTALIDGITEGIDEAKERAGSAVEQPNTEELPVEDLTEELPVEDLTEEQEVDEDAPHTFPEKVISLRYIMESEGKVNMTELVSRLYNMLPDVVDHNADIRITW